MMRCIKNPQSDNPYHRAGFKDRSAYLKALAEDYGLTYRQVREAAELLGCEEDFDALPYWLDEHSQIEPLPAWAQAFGYKNA